MLMFSLDDNEPEWVRKHAMEEKRNRVLRERAELEARLKKIREKEQKEKRLAEQESRYPKKAVSIRGLVLFRNQIILIESETSTRSWNRRR